MGFRSEPRDEGGGVPYGILRVSPGKEVTGIILSRRHVGAELHYWKGRSRLHRRGECEACAAGHKPRWYGYVYVLRTGIGTLSILEFTARCWPTIREYYQSVGDLRGARFNACRVRPQTNAPMSLTLSEIRVPSAGLPDPASLQEVLARMWEVSVPEPSEEDNGRITPGHVEPGVRLGDVLKSRGTK